MLIAVPWDQESGGVASVVGELARHLEGQGHRVLFLHPGLSERPRARTTAWGFRGVELKLRHPVVAGRVLRSVFAFAVYLPRTLRDLLRLLAAERIDIVNVHYVGPAYVYFALCRLFRRFGLVASIHGTDVTAQREGGTRVQPAVRLLLRASSVLVSPSAGFLRQCEPLLPRFPRRAVIHNGVAPLAIAHGEAMLATMPVEPFFLCVASHDAWKGIDVLLHALARLRGDGRAIPLVLAGDGPLRPELERLASQLGIGHLVRFAGYQARPALARLLADCAALVLPSRSEPFGIAILEAMVAGRPVVASRTGGIPEIIEHERQGLLVTPDDVPALAAALSRMLDDPAAAARMGEAGRRRAAEQFTWRHMGEAYERLFEELVDA